MLLIFKNKGILVPVFLMASLIASALTVNLLKTYVGGVFAAEYGMAIPVGFGFIIAGMWTYLTRDSYYISQGQRKRMNEENSFFFISMKFWAYIFALTGFIFIVYGLLDETGYIK